MRYSADRARLLANPELVNGDYDIENGPERQFNKDNIDPDVIAATSISTDNSEENQEVSLYRGYQIRLYHLGVDTH